MYAILGDETFPAVKAASKKEGNVQAAEVVLKVLAERGQYVTPKAVAGPVHYFKLCCRFYLNLSLSVYSLKKSKKEIRKNKKVLH